MKKTIYTPETTLGAVLASCKSAEEILTGFGMHCFYCPMSQAETLAEAAEVHGLDLDLLLEKLNSAK